MSESMAQAALPVEDPGPVVRRAVAGVLGSTPAFAQLSRADQSSLARAMVDVCERAAELVREEIESERAAAPAPPSPVLATAQSAGEAYSGVSASRIASTTRQVLNAVSFPRFVNELITGVFKAILDSNAQQLNQFLELLQNVSASSEGFADMNLGAQAARSWLVEKFPGSFTLDGDPEEEPDPDEPDAGPRLRLLPGGAAPSQEALRAGLGLAESESVPSGDPERTLIPFARRALARQRQQMLSTMVLLGMHRIVIESGRINAAMRFHIDTRSAAADDRGSSFDTRHTASGSGSFGAGPWGVSASMQSTIGYVSTQKTTTTEEMNTDLDLSSSVELNFKSDYLPLNRLTTGATESAIRGNSLNPAAEEQAARTERAGRLEAARTSERERRTTLDRQVTPTTVAPPPQSGAGSVADAEAARQRAAQRESGQTQAGQTQAGQTAAGQTAAGQTAAGRTTAGQTTAGQTTAGQTTAGQTTAGQTTAGQTTAGQTTAGQTTAGQTTAGQTTAGQTTAGTNQGGAARP